MGIFSWVPVVALALTFSSVPPLVQGWINGYNEEFEYPCSNDQHLKEIRSHHDNHHEDRLFDFSCSTVPSGRRTNAHCQWTRSVNDWNQLIVFKCPGEGYVSGLGSYHNNHHEDRRYRFYCCSVPETRLLGCQYSGYVNNYDRQFSYHVPRGRVMKGMVSIHNNHNEDRRFIFETCQISDT